MDSFQVKYNQRIDHRGPAWLGDKTAFETEPLDTFTCSDEISPSCIYIAVVLVVFVVIPESAAKENIIRTARFRCQVGVKGAVQQPFVIAQECLNLLAMSCFEIMN